MNKLECLKINDVVAVKDEYETIISKVVMNNGSKVTFRPLRWLRTGNFRYTYDHCEIFEITKIGVFRPLWVRLLTLNFRPYK